jgi:hypothetical protein
MVFVSHAPFVSFGGMKLQWNTVPPVIQRNLEQLLLARGNDFSSAGIAGFLKGSSGMNYRWDENEEMKRMIDNGIKRCYGDKNRISTDGQGIANIIYSFGRMKFKWWDLPRDIKESFYDGIEKNYSRFCSQEIANIIYSFGEMKFKWADIPRDIKECLYNGIEKNSSRFISQEISSIIHG